MSNDRTISVSPEDGSSDRAQSDADQMFNTGTNKSDREQSDADQIITVDRLDRLIEVSVALSTSAVSVADSTRQELARATAQRKWFMVIMFGMALMVSVLLVPILLIGVSGIHARKELKDCVQPDGRCFKDAQTRTGKAIQDINRVSLLAAACAPDSVNMPLGARTVAIRKCIEAGLK